LTEELPNNIRRVREHEEEASSMGSGGGMIVPMQWTVRSDATDAPYRSIQDGTAASTENCRERNEERWKAARKASELAGDTFSH
jgi:hypothetical protein